MQICYLLVPFMIDVSVNIHKSSTQRKRFLVFALVASSIKVTALVIALCFYIRNVLLCEKFYCFYDVALVIPSAGLGFEIPLIVLNQNY
jgi:hypothetical protein